MDATFRSSGAQSRLENALENHQFSLLTSGAQFFDEVVAAIDGAKVEVHLETYILQCDRSGSRIIECLLRAARRGVAVYLLIDGIGSSLIEEQQLDLWKRQGLQIHVFRPLRHWYFLKRQIFRRLHRKIIVIDRDIAFVGGMNLCDAQLDALDYTLKVQGPLARRVHRYVMVFFFRVTSQWLNYLKAVSVEQVSLRLRRKPKPYDFIVRDNIVHRSQIEEAYLDAISHAKHEIILANPYFLPRRKFRQALRNAAQRGVITKLLLQGQTDLPWIKWATQSLYRSLLTAGIHIFEYEKAFLHGKVAVVDGEWITVGSANLDIFSIFLNLEANLVARDVVLAEKLRSHLLAAIENGSREIHLREYSALSTARIILSKLSLWFLRIVRLLAGTREEED